jgi:hypothetical protein
MTKQTVRWEEREGGRIIRFREPLVSPGWSGRRWLMYLRTQKFSLHNPFVESVLLSESFLPQPGQEYHPIILKWPLWPDEIRNDLAVIWVSCEMGLYFPRVELACLMRQALNDEDLQAMGLDWLNIMHMPVLGPGTLGHLEITRTGGGRWLSGHVRPLDYRYPRGEGFLFEDPAGVIGNGRTRKKRFVLRKPPSSSSREPDDFDDP